MPSQLRFLLRSVLIRAKVMAIGLLNGKSEEGVGSIFPSSIPLAGPITTSESNL